MTDTQGAVGTDNAETPALDLDSILSQEIDAGTNTEPGSTEQVEAPSEGDSPDDAQSTEATETPAETFKVTVDGEDIEVTLDEALKGYQRQSDYTRKTQQLAQERERLAAFDALDKQFAADPAGTLQALAQAMGVDLNTGNQTVEDSPEFDPEDPIQRELAELRDWRREVEADRQAREAAERQAAVDRELERVKVTFDQPDLDEAELLRFAIDNQIPNLEMAYRAMAFEKQAKQSQDAGQKVLDQKRQAPPVEGGGNRNVGVVKGSSDRPSLDEAWQMALSDLN